MVGDTSLVKGTVDNPVLGGSASKTKVICLATLLFIVRNRLVRADGRAGAVGLARAVVLRG